MRDPPSGNLHKHNMVTLKLNPILLAPNYRYDTRVVDLTLRINSDGYHARDNRTAQQQH